MKRKKFLATAIAISLTFSMTACGGGSSSSGSTDDGDASGKITPMSVNLGYDSAEDSVTGLSCTEFKRLVEEKSNGSITVNVYPSGQLGSDKEMIQSCISGDIEFVAQNTGPQVANVPGASVFDMPGLFLNPEIARKTIDNPDFRTLFDAEYTKVGLKLLMISDMGYRQTSTNTKITDMNSLKGMNIRTMENPIHIAFWKALGCNPTPMNRGEVFLALQQGLLDAQEDPFVNIYLNNYQEVQKYIVDTNHIFHTITMITNDAWYNNLEPAQRAVFDETIPEILAYSREKADSINEEYVQKLVDAGVTYIQLSDEMHKEIQKVGETIYPMIRETAGDELVDALLKAMEEASN